MSEPTLGHRLEYVGLRLVMAVVSMLPEAAASLVGTVLGRIAGSVLRIRRGVVDENLERAFPEESRAWRNRVARDTYVHFGREFLQLMRFNRVPLEELGRRIEVEGLERVRAPLESGRGVVILTAHLGNWEIGAVGVTANALELAAVAKRQANPLFDEYVRALREHLGIVQVYQREAPRKVLKWLRRPGAVALVADQNAGRAGIFVDFFGVPASTARGPAVFAARTGADVVLAAPGRLPGARPRYVLRFECVEWEPSDDQDENVRRLLRSYMRMLEDAIRRTPEQYFWFHKRWKTRPDRESRARSSESAGETARANPASTPTERQS